MQVDAIFEPGTRLFEAYLRRHQKDPIQPQYKERKHQAKERMRKRQSRGAHAAKVQDNLTEALIFVGMSRAEVILLYESAEEHACFETSRTILGQMGISFREEPLPSTPTLTALRQSIEAVGQSVCVWAAGKSAYLLPVVASSLPPTQPLIVIPCPSEAAPLPYLEAIFETVRGYPLAFTRPRDAQAATLLAVHALAARHPSYADLLQAYLHKRPLQPA